MQRSHRIHWLSWTLLACFAALSTRGALAQSSSKPAGAPRSAVGSPRNTARPGMVAPSNRAAPSSSQSVATPSPTPAPKPVSTAANPVVTKPTASGTFRLAHNLKAGEIIRTRTTHIANTITRVQGTEDVSESKSISDKVWEVHSVDPDGTMTLEYRIDAVDMMQKQGDKERITYNSRTDKEVPDMFSRVAETISKPIAIVTIDSSGSIVERDNQSKAPPLGMGELALPLPKEAVAIGAQWSIPRECRVKLDDGTQKVVKLREQYTLEKVSAGIATIRIQTHPLTPVDEPSVEAQLMQQMSEGVAKFDIDRGRMISKQLDWDDEIVGFRGAETSLKYTARFTEEPK